MFQRIFNVVMLLAMLVSTGSFAQTMIPLPAHDRVYSSQARGFWFTAPCNFTITGVRVPADAGTGDQYIQIIEILDNPPVVYGTISSNMTTLEYIAGAPNGVIQNVSIPVTTGQIIGVFGTVGSSSDNSYSASSPYSTTLNGYTISLGRLITQQSNGIYNAQSPDYSTENSSSLGRVELYYSVCDKPTGVTANSITSNSANLSWTAVSGSAGYEYVVDMSSTAPTGSGTFTTATSYNAFGLTSSTNYFFHVRNKCDATTFSLWETIPFTTDVNPCPFPNTVTYNTPTASNADFHWLPMPGSLGYEYVVDQIASPPLAPGTGTIDTFANFSGLNGGQAYYFHLRNKCSSTGGTWSDWNTIQFIMPECKAPVNILFSGVSDTAVDILWAMMPEANLYEYQVDQNITDPTGASGYSSTTGITAHINGLLSNTKYYAHIRSRCFINDASNWAIDSFITHYACNAPVPVVTNPGSSNPVVNWAPIDDAVQYEYRVSSNPNHPAFGDVTTTATTMTTTLPNDGKNYYLHIRTKCNSQYEFSGWARADLRVTPTGIDVLDDDAFAINVYPNPAQNNITVKIDGSIENDGQVMITDITGKLLLSTSIHDADTDIDISKLTPGIYLLKYQDMANNRVIKVEKK